MACGEDHSFVVNRKELLRENTITFHCPQTGIPQLFIGRDKDVREKVDALEKDLDDLISFFGYDSYFCNTQVMIDTINKIHDIAQQEDLICECGSTDIEVFLLSDKIFLKCRECTGSKIIKAVSNEDLKNILKKNQLVLSTGRNNKKSIVLLGRTDGK
jgi:hypothetical protein